MVVNGRVKPREDTDLIDVAVGPTAYPLDEFILVLGIPTAYVTGQSVCVHRSHRERLGGRNGKEIERKGRGKARTPGIRAVDPSSAFANRYACTWNRVRTA